MPKFAPPHTPCAHLSMTSNHACTVAWRVNLGFAAVGGSASGFVYLASCRFVVSRPCAVLAAGLFALNPLVWAYSSHAEVFSLNNMLCSALVYHFLVYNDKAASSAARRGALVTGLCLANQHTSVLLAGPLAAAVLVRSGGTLLRPRELLMLLGYIALGKSKVDIRSESGHTRWYIFEDWG